jgi:uncharacterized DUF497 family protein
MKELIFEKCVGFEWDQENQDKNCEKHGVSRQEGEEIFFNKPLIIYEDIKHSRSEEKLYLLGQTDENRKLFIAFTIRKNLIRVVSARDMSRKEHKIYDKN